MMHVPFVLVLKGSSFILVYRQHVYVLVHIRHVFWNISLQITNMYCSPIQPHLELNLALLISPSVVSNSSSSVSVP